MFQFNPDGSLKVPEHISKANDENKERMRGQRCVKFKKEVLSFTSPKKCVLHLTLSDVLSDADFVEKVYAYFKEKSSVPTKLIKINDKEYDVEVGTDFRRCTDCCSLIGKFRDFLDGNVIEIKGSCTFERRNFSDEDYF